MLVQFRKIDEILLWIFSCCRSPEEAFKFKDFVELKPDLFCDYCFFFSLKSGGPAQAYRAPPLDLPPKICTPRSPLPWHTAFMELCKLSSTSYKQNGNLISQYDELMVDVKIIDFFFASIQAVMNIS